MSYYIYKWQGCSRLDLYKRTGEEDQLLASRGKAWGWRLAGIIHNTHHDNVRYISKEEAAMILFSCRETA